MTLDSPRMQRLLRAAGLATWALDGTPMLLDLWHQPDLLGQALPRLRLAGFLAFGLAFSLKPGAADSRRRRAQAMACLAVQSGGAIAMGYRATNGYWGVLLVLVAMQLPAVVSLRGSVGWVLAQTLAMAGIVALMDPLRAAVLFSTVYLGLQTLALVTGRAAELEASARRDLARANAELLATRELLADSSRLAERVRISRELHDVLGHRLAALSLNLEVASHVAEGPALEHVRQAQAVTKGLLGDVREAVGSMRRERGVEIAGPLDLLVRGISRPRVHLQVPSGLRVDDPARAHVLLRCVQEIVTNAVRHAAADNLWIAIVPTAEAIEIRARDDGVGAMGARPGLGLTGMRERLEEIGGRLDIAAAPGRGFGLNAWLPTSARPEPIP